MMISSLKKSAISSLLGMNPGMPSCRSFCLYTSHMYLEMTVTSYTVSSHLSNLAAHSIGVIPPSLLGSSVALQSHTTPKAPSPIFSQIELASGLCAIVPAFLLIEKILSILKCRLYPIQCQ
jgi:hypothetical protein